MKDSFTLYYCTPGCGWHPQFVTLGLMYVASDCLWFSCSDATEELGSRRLDYVLNRWHMYHWWYGGQCWVVHTVPIIWQWESNGESLRQWAELYCVVFEHKKKFGHPPWASYWLWKLLKSVFTDFYGFQIWKKHHHFCWYLWSNSWWQVVHETALENTELDSWVLYRTRQMFKR